MRGSAPVSREVGASSPSEFRHLKTLVLSSAKTLCQKPRSFRGHDGEVERRGRGVTDPAANWSWP
jgi:hypothetical protein